MRPTLPCTTNDVASVGRRRTVRYPLVRVPCTTPTNVRRPLCNSDVSCLRGWSGRGDLACCSCRWWESGVTQSLGTRKAAITAANVGQDLRRVTLAKCCEVFPVGSCLTPRGATIQFAEACSGRSGGHTEVLEASCASHAATSVVLWLQTALGCDICWI